MESNFLFLLRAAKNKQTDRQNMMLRASLLFVLLVGVPALAETDQGRPQRRYFRDTEPRFNPNPVHKPSKKELRLEKQREEEARKENAAHEDPSLKKMAGDLDGGLMTVAEMDATREDIKAKVHRAAKEEKEQKMMAARAQREAETRAAMNPWYAAEAIAKVDAMTKTSKHTPSLKYTGFKPMPRFVAGESGTEEKQPMPQLPPRFVPRMVPEEEATPGMGGFSGAASVSGSSFRRISSPPPSAPKSNAPVLPADPVAVVAPAPVAEPHVLHAPAKEVQAAKPEPKPTLEVKKTESAKPAMPPSAELPHRSRRHGPVRPGEYKARRSEEVPKPETPQTSSLRPVASAAASVVPKPEWPPAQEKKPSPVQESTPASQEAVGVAAARFDRFAHGGAVPPPPEVPKELKVPAASRASGVTPPTTVVKLNREPTEQQPQHQVAKKGVEKQQVVQAPEKKPTPVNPEVVSAKPPTHEAVVAKPAEEAPKPETKPENWARKMVNVTTNTASKKHEVGPSAKEVVTKERDMAKTAAKKPAVQGSPAHVPASQEDDWAWGGVSETSGSAKKPAKKEEKPEKVTVVVPKEERKTTATVVNSKPVVVEEKITQPVPTKKGENCACVHRNGKKVCHCV